MEHEYNKCKRCRETGGCWKYYFFSVVDFIRWAELIFSVFSFIVFHLLFGWWGIIPFLIFDWLNHLQGGLMGDLSIHPPKEYPENKCSKEIKNCRLCNNPYSHEFNVKYQKSLKWYEKL